MKSAALTVFVALVFVAGVGAGVFLFQQPASPAPAPVVAASAAPSAPQPAPQPVELQPVGPGAGAQDAAATSPAPGAAPDAVPAGPAAPPPSDMPPALSPEAVREGERAAAEAAGEGNGKVTHLVYEFESEEEREAWEAKRRASWETRLQREQDIKVRVMQEKVGLTAAQAGRLREILNAEFEERERLVTALSRNEISRSSFDDGVQANLASARDALGQLLTQDQLEAYGQLKPREQVLRTDTAGGF